MKITKRQLRRIIKEAMDSTQAFVDVHYDDFIDSYIRSSSGPDEFMDMWLLKLDDAGVRYDQDDLVELLERAVENGEMEEGEIFLGEKGAW